MSYRPLAGIRVLDISRLYPGALTTQKLADLGADVVKIEEPGRGDYLRTIPPLVEGRGILHLVLDRGKRSVAARPEAARGRGRVPAARRGHRCARRERTARSVRRDGNRLRRPTQALSATGRLLGLWFRADGPAGAGSLPRDEHGRPGGRSHRRRLEGAEALRRARLFARGRAGSRQRRARHRGGGLRGQEHRRGGLDRRLLLGRSPRDSAAAGRELPGRRRVPRPP